MSAFWRLRKRGRPATAGVLDPRRYAKGIKVSDAEMARLNVQGDEFHPEWNYTIAPRTSHPT